MCFELESVALLNLNPYKTQLKKFRTGVVSLVIPLGFCFFLRFYTLNAVEEFRTD